MKYNLKTAVHVTDEFTRQNLIEFFEAIKSDCNTSCSMPWIIDDINIGEVWGILNSSILSPSIDESDYTIIKGIPENWREDMENEPETDPQTKIDKLETENKELRECLEFCVIELESNYKRLGFYNSNILTQAKQLLNK